MKKYLKLLTLLLSTTCLTEAADTETTISDPTKVVATFDLRIPAQRALTSSGDVETPEQRILASVNRVMQDPETGRGYTGGQLTTGDLKIGVLLSEEDANDELYTSTKRAILDAYSEGGLDKMGFEDLRSPEEQRCDWQVKYILKDLLELYNKLSYFADGIQDDLIELLRVTQKLTATNSIIVDAAKLFPELITKTIDSATALQSDLSADVRIILSALGQTINHLETYVDSRYPIAKERATGRLINLKDLLPPENDVSDKRVILGGVNITDIHKTSSNIEILLNDIMRKKLRTKFLGVHCCFEMCSKLTTKTAHTRQIHRLSQPFKGDLAVIDFIDENWRINTHTRFEGFKEGVKYINMLIENIRDYAAKIQSAATGRVAEHLLEPHKTSPSTTLVATTASSITMTSQDFFPEGTNDQTTVLQKLKTSGEFAWAGLEREQDDLADTQRQIKKYLTSTP